MNAVPKTGAVSCNASITLPDRGRYNEILNFPAEAMALAARVNKQIGFVSGIESVGKRGGFLANNFEVYGYDLNRNLIAMQYRQAWKANENRWLRIRKAYVLAGLDEGDQVFSHVLNTSYQRNPNLGESSAEQVIRWAESKIFRLPLHRLHTIIRQGDIALVPVRSIPRTAPMVDLSTLTLRESHKVLIDGLCFLDRNSGRIWVDGLVQIDHTPGQHKSVDAEGRFEIVQGERGYARFIDANTVD
jgi:hypothetical protein